MNFCGFHRVALSSTVSRSKWNLRMWLTRMHFLSSSVWYTYVRWVLNDSLDSVGVSFCLARIMNLALLLRQLHDRCYDSCFCGNQMFFWIYNCSQGISQNMIFNFYSRYVVETQRSENKRITEKSSEAVEWVNTSVYFQPKPIMSGMEFSLNSRRSTNKA